MRPRCLHLAAGSVGRGEAGTSPGKGAVSQFRVSPPRVFPVATRSSRPAAEAAGSADAHRQSGFILGNEIDLLLQGLSLESDVARQASTSRYRNHVVASTMVTWSRSWLCRLDALHALEWGNYVASTSLVRSGAELLAAAYALLETSAADWVNWLDSGGIAPAHEEHATRIRIDDPLAVAGDSDLIGRVLEDSALLAAPSHAASVLLSAPESTPVRIAAVFGDRDFNLGAAELNLGWLLSLSTTWLDILAMRDTFPVPNPAELATWRAGVDRALARRDRCRMEPASPGGQSHKVISNWRRSPGGAPRRIVL